MEVRVQIKNRQQMLLFAAVGLLLFFVGDKFILSPLVDGWQARSKRISELKHSIAQGDMMLQRERSFRDRWNQNRTNMLSSNPSVAQSQIFKAFDRWAQDSRMKVGSI